MKIRLYALYDNFTLDIKPKYIEWVKEDCGISIYTDEFIKTNDIDKNAMALLIEPRSIQPAIYEYIKENYTKFKYVFTHDDILLNALPNAKKIVFGGIYDTSNSKKTKQISMVSSDKQMCELHIQRLKLIRELADNPKVDCLGTWNGGKYVSTKEAHKEYRFAIVIENYISDYWFTEKICNCFANKCIPIYLGARKINEYFNADGIIQANSIDDIKSIILNLDCDTEYEKRINAVNENYERVKKYRCFEDWFYNEYKELLKERV